MAAAAAAPTISGKRGKSGRPARLVKPYACVGDGNGATAWCMQARLARPPLRIQDTYDTLAACHKDCRWNDTRGPRGRPATEEELDEYLALVRSEAARGYDTMAGVDHDMGERTSGAGPVPQFDTLASLRAMLLDRSLPGAMKGPVRERLAAQEYAQRERARVLYQRRGITPSVAHPRGQPPPDSWRRAEGSGTTVQSMDGRHTRGNRGTNPDKGGPRTRQEFPSILPGTLPAALDQAVPMPGLVGHLSSDSDSDSDIMIVEEPSRNPLRFNTTTHTGSNAAWRAQGRRNPAAVASGGGAVASRGGAGGGAVALGGVAAGGAEARGAAAWDEDSDDAHMLTITNWGTDSSDPSEDERPQPVNGRGAKRKKAAKRGGPAKKPR